VTFGGRTLKGEAREEASPTPSRRSERGSWKKSQVVSLLQRGGVAGRNAAWRESLRRRKGGGGSHRLSEKTMVDICHTVNSYKGITCPRGGFGKGGDQKHGLQRKQQ